MLTIDASVWVNAASPHEPGSSDSRALLDQLSISRTPIIVPTLLRVETAAAIARSRHDAGLALRYSQKLAAISFIQWVSLDLALADRASLLASEHGLRGADAIYAPVAITYACDLISLDNEHLTRLSGVIRVLTPSQSLIALRNNP